jgi:hypothetical protein
MEAQKFDNAKAHEYVQAKYVVPAQHARGLQCCSSFCPAL